MSADTTPTRVTSGTSRPLATRLVPTRTSRRPAANASSTRSAAPLRSTTSRSSRPTRSSGNRSRTSRSTRSVPPPRYRIRGERAGRAAGRGRPGAAAVVAAQRGPGPVVDQRPVAVRARLHVPAVPAHDDRRRPPPVDHEDRPVAGLGVEGRQRRRERVRQQPAVARGELGAQVDGADRAAPCPPAGRAARRAGTGPRARGPCSRPTASRSPRTTAAPAIAARSMRGVARLEPRRPVALVGGVVLLVDDRSRPTSASGATSAIRVPTTTSASPARIRRHSSARSPSPRAECSSATRTGRSARRRSTIGVASAISGTRSSAGRPAARQAAIAST